VTDPDFREAFRDHKDVVFRFAYRMTGSSSAAEDIAQDCFVALWRKPAAYDGRRGALRAYLLGIARNLILKCWRDTRPHEPLEADTAASPPVDLEGMERAEAIAQAVAALPPLQREALVLAEYEDLSLDEIACATGADLAAVKSRLHRARENLRRTLAPLLEQKGSVYGTK
jgi:RNA polymerase sigma-70 factor (ECF subfamily)